MALSEAGDRPHAGDLRLAAKGGAHVAVSTTVLLLAYVLLPLDHLSHVPFALIVPLELVLFFGLTVFEVRAILRATYPAIRALEALGVLVPLFLLLFATTYFMLGARESGSFSETLSRLDALYFTVTVFATVGFGDITATTPNARVIVTVQMVTDLIVLGAGLKVIVAAVRRRRESETSAS